MPDPTPRRRWRGSTLILTKGIGVGIYSAAFKKDTLPAAAYEELIASTTLLNRIGAELARDPAVHAITGVTGFGCSAMRWKWRADRVWR